MISMELKMAEIAFVIAVLYLHVYVCKLILEFHLVHLLSHDCLELSGYP